MNGRRGAPFHDTTRPEPQGQDDWYALEEAEIAAACAAVPKVRQPRSGIEYRIDEHGGACDCPNCGLR